MTHIMIVEDDKKMNEGIQLALRQEQYIFTACRTLQEARDALRIQDMDLVLLDVNLPDGNGMEFVREIRSRYQMPIILLTVNNMELDIVTGLEAGANDYITKPFSLMVLRARVQVQLRGKQEKQDHYRFQGLDLDFSAMQFYKNGMPIELSLTEQKILKVLCENSGAVVKRSSLIDSVWSGETEFVEEHALTVAVKRLRDKLEKSSAGGEEKQEYIKTVYGIGYTWAGTS
ncbi:MAG: response regulator transcription factor [Eubacterium sp.]|nr:response regulator transcription factor [Eubacterium sp.]